MKKIFAILLLSFLILQNQKGYAQIDSLKKEIDTLVDNRQSKAHIYKLNFWVSTSFSVVATAANIYAIPNIIKAKQPLTEAEFDGLNPSTYSGFDRWALEQDPYKKEKFYKASDYLLPGVVASAATLGLDKQISKDWLRVLFLYYETHAVTFSLYNFSFLGPAFQNKLRPIVYYNEFSREERRGGNNRNSLYSGHTASTAAATFFMVKVYADYHPEIGKKKYLLYGLASVPPLVEGYLRMKALAHFPSDIMVGFLVGATCGVVVPALHKINSEKIQLGLSGYGKGGGFNLTYNL